MYHIKNDKRAKQSSKLIFNALRKLSQERNYDSITITQITDLAKIGRATFYRNFDTKDDVLLYEIDKKCSMLVSYVHKSLSEGNNRNLFRLTVEFWDVHTDIIELLMRTNKTILMYAPLLNIMIEFKHLYAEIATEDEEFQYIAELRTHLMIVVLCKWIKSGKYLTENQLIQLASDHMKKAAKINVF